MPKKSKYDGDEPRPVRKESLGVDAAVGVDELDEAEWSRLNVEDVHPIDLSFPGLKVLHLNPPIYRIEGLLSAEECDALVALPETGRCLELPKEANTAGAAAAARRTSTTWYARFGEPPVRPLLERASKLFRDRRLVDASYEPGPRKGASTFTFQL